MNSNESLLSARQVADILSVDRVTVLRLARQGKLPCLRFNSRFIRFDPADVQKFIDSCQVIPAGNLHAGA